MLTRTKGEARAERKAPDLEALWQLRTEIDRYAKEKFPSLLEPVVRHGRVDGKATGELRRRTNRHPADDAAAERILAGEAVDFRRARTLDDLEQLESDVCAAVLRLQVREAEAELERKRATEAERHAQYRKLVESANAKLVEAHAAIAEAHDFALEHRRFGALPAVHMLAWLRQHASGVGLRDAMVRARWIERGGAK